MIIISTIPCNALSWAASLGRLGEGLPTLSVWEFLLELHRRAESREGGRRVRDVRAEEEKCNTVLKRASVLPRGHRIQCS